MWSVDKVGAETASVAGAGGLAEAVAGIADRLAEAVRRNLFGLLKTGTYGAMHLAVAVAVAFAVSGSWAIALGIGLVEPLVQTIFYHLHERLWGRARPGAQSDISAATRLAAAAGSSAPVMGRPITR